MRPSVKLTLLTRAKHIPLITIFELTRRCNLKCRHCYIDAPKNAKNELSTEKIKSILSQLAKAGSLDLVFTGGEIFLREDILELCRFARRLNFDLRLFTNGTFIDVNMAGLMSRMGLGGVEISLYGKEATHDNITRVKGSFKKTLNAIHILKKAGVPVTIKCPITKLNFNEYLWIVRFAKRNKIRFRLDPEIAPKDSGDKEILKYRLSGRQLKQLFTDPVIGQKPEAPSGEPDFSCSAATNMVTIGFDGTVYPCLQLRLPIGDLKKEKLLQIWNSKNTRLSEFRNLTIDDFPKCRDCRVAVICRRCPGIALLEDKTLTGPSKIACKIAKIQNSINSRQPV